VTADAQRKKCPQCGYANRTTAKVCANCGHRFLKAEIQGLRKYCTQCGTPNRIRARVCKQCGKAFRAAVPTKWCTQCGKPRRENAKVCSSCGYRFPTRRQPEEPPVKPFADQPLTLPPVFDELIPLPPEREAGKVAVKPDATTPMSEPAPFISNDELNQLRGKGLYNKRTTELTLRKKAKGSR
jgi:ribosomal protein L37E